VEACRRIEHRVDQALRHAVIANEVEADRLEGVT